MTPNDVRQEIDNCLDLMLHSGITLIANPVVVERNGRKARVTWRSPAGLGTLEGTYPFATVDEYREHLRNQAYSAVLCDGSLLQIVGAGQELSHFAGQNSASGVSRWWLSKARVK